MRRVKKLVREGQLVAEVEVNLVEAPDGWAPYVSLEDALRLDEVRRAMRRGDLHAASAMGQVYELTPVAG